ncbi:MAG: DUF4921 family protein [Planctomycetales bacterium]|nr:DUF4921 family protein [Planctomycetales bacterium]
MLGNPAEPDERRHGDQAETVTLRRDPLTGDRVLVASDRELRPFQFSAAPALEDDPPSCPFCPANEAETPEPRVDYGVREGNWSCRVVPNRYPAVEGELGRHGVIIESSRHVLSWTGLTPHEQQSTLVAYRDQLRRAAADGFAYTQLFKNSGAEAGASLAHSHSQLLATGDVPTRVQAELAGAATYLRSHGRCFFCECLGETAERVVARTDRLTAFCPYASRFAYEVWVAPNRHESRFELADDRLLAELADLLHRIVGAWEEMIADVSYNWLLHTAPAVGSPSVDESYHWHFELIPRVAKLAGFELATDQYINTVDPAEAAERLAERLADR